MRTESQHSFWHKMIAPLYVLKQEWSYGVWLLFVAFFGLINIWGGLLLGRFDTIASSFKEGVVYTYAISICAPFLAETIVKQIVKKRTGVSVEFVSYQMICSAINIVLILVLTFLWLGSFKGNIVGQIIAGLISTAFAFYMYCVGQMEQHKSSFSDYDDPLYDYLKEEKASMDNMSENSKALTTISGKEGDIEI